MTVYSSSTSLTCSLVGKNIHLLCLLLTVQDNMDHGVIS